MIAERVSTDNFSSSSSTTTTTTTNINNNNSNMMNFKTDNLFDGLEFPTVPSNRIIINKNDTFPVTSSSTLTSTLLNSIDYDIFHVDNHHSNVIKAETDALLLSSSSSSSLTVEQNKKTSNLSTLYATEVSHRHHHLHHGHHHHHLHHGHHLEHRYHGQYQLYYDHQHRDHPCSSFIIII